MALTLDDVRRAMASPVARDPGPQAQFAVRLPDGSDLSEVNVPPPESDPRHAAVLALIYPRHEGLHLLLTQRTDELPEHSGQISLPGGAYESGDASLMETALRETEEELGIDSENVEVVGELAPVYVHVSNFSVTPFVALAPEPPTYRPDPIEVEEVLEVPLAALLDNGAVKRETWELHGVQVEVGFYRYGKWEIWGATARMLSMLVAALRSLRNP